METLVLEACVVVHLKNTVKGHEVILHSEAGVQAD
jgi:hypothetical protein